LFTTLDRVGNREHGEGIVGESSTGELRAAGSDGSDPESSGDEPEDEPGTEGTQKLIGDERETVRPITPQHPPAPS
jgi:hypothetical protein